MFDYTPAILELLADAVANELRRHSPFVIEQRRATTYAVCELEDGTVLTARNADGQARWTTSTEPTLIVDRWTTDQWTEHSAPFISARTRTAISPTEVSDLILTQIGLTFHSWLEGYDRLELEAHAKRYAPEVEALRRLGLNASFKILGHGITRLTARRDDESEVYFVSNDNWEGDLACTGDRTESWRIDAVDADIAVIDAHGRRTPLGYQSPSTDDGSTEGLVKLAISSGFAPNLTNWEPPAVDAITIPDVAAAVIADIWDYVYASPFSRSTVIGMFEAEALSLSQRSTAVVRAFAAQTSRPRQEWTEEYRSLVRSWIKARLIEPDS